MNASDVLFLVVGVIVVVVVGQLLAYSGRRYVAGMQKGSGTGSIAVLTSVVFHLVTLGLLALISVLPIGSTATQSFMLRLGILLLVLGGIYAATLSILSHRRQDAVAEEAIAEHRQSDQAHHQARQEDAEASSAPWQHVQGRDAEVPQHGPDVIRPY